MYLMSVNSQDFVELVKSMTATLPRLGQADKHSSGWAANWLAIKDMDLTRPMLQTDVLEALEEAFESTGIGPGKAHYRDFRVRLGWLQRDLKAAPVRVAESIYLDGSRPRPENRRVILTGLGFECVGFGYLLGVLLSEIGRLEGVSSEIIQTVDSRGVLEVNDLGEDGLGIIRRTLDSIVAGDRGRSFVNDSGGLNELELFTELRAALPSE